ncbi:hypothetical protein HS088_TW21G01368 [Tripterygium wilfordii]|uniref:Transmembrane protein n=1 Tax=Tripterygium wilfordii TaxID=458696 RepID=A0A7J7C4X3_TRIWF|nr:hypothetical protein HS088_TW21G01368 [Tripterygium wilfordii]
MVLKKKEKEKASKIVRKTHRKSTSRRRKRSHKVLPLLPKPNSFFLSVYTLVYLTLIDFMVKGSKTPGRGDSCRESEHGFFGRRHREGAARSRRDSNRDRTGEGGEQARYWTELAHPPDARPYACNSQWSGSLFLNNLFMHSAYVCAPASVFVCVYFILNWKYCK